MNYDLAKKLKEAGWPQETKKGEKIWRIICEGTPDVAYEEPCYAPTLSELIEACDLTRKKSLDGYLFVDFHIRVDNTSLWRCGLQLKDGEKCFSDEGYGKTPEEAVANLWLKLNKK